MNIYRLRVTSRYHVGSTSHSYIVRNRNGDVHYCSANETPLALSNLLSEAAAETRFALEDAKDGREAVKILRGVLAQMWHRAPDKAPEVEILPGEGK